MNQNEPRWVVDSVQNDRVIVRFTDRECPLMLSHLGGERGKGVKTWVYRCGSDHEIASLFATLRDLGVPFQGAASGWPPAEIFALLREKGLLRGPFQEALFGGPKAGWTVRGR